MFQANYHTHTKRCGHATGEDEDYVLEALGRGYRYLGFSDHAMLPDFSEPYVRGDYSLFQGYVDSIRSLEKKYADRLTIYCGFEAESFPDYFPYYKELLANGILDYLILGNHCAINRKKEIVTRFINITNPGQLYLYKDLALQALATGMFSVFVHPDYFMAGIDNFDSDCKKVSREMIEACIAYDVPLEVNVAGIRNGKRHIGQVDRWMYPTDDFFSLVSKYKAKCVYGMDAHAPAQLANDAADFAAVQFAKEHHLVMVDVLDKIRHHS
ncbi:MAG: histidinol-phosphatase [Bacilli bacterium]|jgi:histidinol-phosphatase (PHP family)|nr:histidinol-phosphatase [Bacilli bacterium]